MHPNKEEVKQKHLETCMDEQGAPGQTHPTEGGSIDKEPEENTEKLLKQTGIRLGKLTDLQIELNLARGIEGNKKNYYGYVSDKKKTERKCALPDGNRRCGYLVDGEV